MDIIRKAFMPGDFKLDGQGAVTVAFAQLGVIDKDKDVSLPGSFPVGKTIPMSAYGHTSWDGALPIGKGAIREDAKWAIFDGQFLMSTDQGKNAYETVKAMADLQEWSYGLDPSETAYGKQDGVDVRFIKRQDVYEVSPVLMGAGIATHTMGMKGAPGPDAPYAEHLAWLLREMKALTDRTRDRADWRAKEGRGLSEKNRAQLEELRKELDLLGIDLEELIVLTEPTKSVEARHREIEILVEMARANGVTV